MMIVASWNIRGIHPAHKRDGVRGFLREHSVSLMGIFETKIKADVVRQMMQRQFRGWDFFHNSTSPDTPGRILTIWDPCIVSIVILSSTTQHTLCKVTPKDSRDPCYVSFMHGLHSITDRRPL